MYDKIRKSADGAFDTAVFDLTIDQPGQLGLAEWCNIKLVRDRNVPYSEQIRVRGPEDVGRFVTPFFEEQASEVVVMLALSAANCVISAAILSRGDISASIVSPRSAFQFLCMQNSAAGIWVHNHPSGNSDPSREDIKISRVMKEAGKIMGIPIHDSIIWTADGIVSLTERNLI